MAIQARTPDYNFDAPAPELAADGGAAARPVGRTADAQAVEFLQLLARAVQQFHTYPPASPICRGAIETAQRALLQMRREQISFRVAPADLIFEETPAGRGTTIEIELARRLHRAGIAQVTIEQSVSIRELTHFACDLLAASSRDGSHSRLIEVLAEHGVDRIALRPAYRPEVLPVHAPAQPVAELLEAQRQRHEQAFAGARHADHLYPPDKGWVRLDPSARVRSVSLVDLALLAGEPAALADMLVRLTDDDEGAGGQGEALAQKYNEVALIFSALDPRVARVMFSKLARAVLDLDTERRQNLLRRAVLPGLLDGRIEGTILHDFPDVDLAESLCLLLDLETASPEVVSTALSRLNLAPEREAQVLPIIEQHVRQRDGARPEELGLDAHARRLIRVDASRGRSFAEFSAFDLSLDAAALQALGDIRDRIASSDMLADQLACFWHLVQLEPNPEQVERFLGRAEPLVSELQRQGRWAEFADWVVRHRGLATSHRESRPDVSEIIDARLRALSSREQAARLVALADRDDEGRAAAGRIIGALGADIGPALLAALRTPGTEARDGRTRSAIQLLCDHAALVAPALAQAAAEADATTTRIIARVLGLAGPGHEAVLGKLLESGDEQTVREALRGLARVGTARAASLVGAQLRQKDWRAAAAEQTLWHFPPAETQREVRALLARREFVLQCPAVALRLLDRVAQSGTSGLEGTLRSAAPLMYRFWNPALMRLGRRARALLTA